MTFDFIPFANLDGISIAVVFAVYYLSFFIRGILGFGSAMPAVLGSAWILPPHDAILLALLTSVFAQVQLLPQGFRDANWKIAKPILAGTIVSVIIGVWIFVSLSAAWLTIVLGLVLSAAVLTDMARLAERLASRLRLDGFAVAFSLATLAGLISGVAGAGSNYFLSFYIRWAAPTPREFRATNIVISGFMNLWRALITLVAGLITIKLTVEALLVMPAVYAGLWGGKQLTGRLSSERYFGLFRWLLLIAATALIWKGTAALNQAA
ncbi:MAG: sulfite exporter TauE/SafE family protein [Hyphomicrobiaceae bacterium]